MCAQLNEDGAQLFARFDMVFICDMNANCLLGASDLEISCHLLLSSRIGLKVMLMSVEFFY